MEQRGRFLTDETLRTLDLGPPSHLATFSVLGGGTIMGAESIRNDTGSQKEFVQVQVQVQDSGASPVAVVEEAPGYVENRDATLDICKNVNICRSLQRVRFNRTMTFRLAATRVSVT
jgi:hypothetical protein